LAKYKGCDISYQLGTYYDMGYMRYFTRSKFILGLSRYNDDDTAFEREEEMKVSVILTRMEIQDGDMTNLTLFYHSQGIQLKH
jgi:hypothetical protein